MKIKLPHAHSESPSLRPSSISYQVLAVARVRIRISDRQTAWSWAFEKLCSFDLLQHWTSDPPSDPPSFQPSPKLKSQLARWCSLSPSFQVNCCPWSSHTAPLNALVGWQCNAGDGYICVLIPRRFKYPLHSMYGWLYNEGSLFNHDRTMYYVPLMWQVAINSFFLFCWLLYPPSTLEFLGKKIFITYFFIQTTNIANHLITSCYFSIKKNIQYHFLFFF